MNALEWQKGVDAALEAGFLATGMTCTDVGTLDDLEGEDRAAAVEAVLADEGEAVEHFCDVTQTYSGHWSIAKCEQRAAGVTRLVEALKDATAAHARGEKAEHESFATLGRVLAALMYQQIEPGLTDRLQDKAPEWDEVSESPAQHAHAENLSHYQEFARQARSALA